MTTIIGIISKKLKDRGLIPFEISRRIKDVANVMSSGKIIKFPMAFEKASFSQDWSNT